jgi:predicted fused transcriptional regulator/phosphomethylpyrimidine kinase/predicted transcriptional regulator
MNPPSEIMTRHLLPALRGLVAHNLSRKGYSQSRIATFLGVTQASVSFYLADPSATYFLKIKTLGLLDADTERYVETLSEDVIRGRVEAIYTISSLWKNLLATGTMCPLHRRESEILEDCDVCMRLYGSTKAGVERSRILHEVERAAKTVEGSLLFPAVMPEVSVNIVMAAPGALSEMDIAALPGRMVKIRGRADHMLPAEFGVSRHMARMLLTAMQWNPLLRAAVNIRYDHRVGDILLDMGLSPIRISKKDHVTALEGDQVVSAFATKINSGTASDAQIVVDEGGEGLEPNTYVFGGNATKAVLLALEIARRYVER